MVEMSEVSMPWQKLRNIVNCRSARAVSWRALHPRRSELQEGLRTLIVEVCVYIGEVIVQRRLQADSRRFLGQTHNGIGVFFAEGRVQSTELDTLNRVGAPSRFLTRYGSRGNEAGEQRKKLSEMHGGESLRIGMLIQKNVPYVKDDGSECLSSRE
jgi:hypothetical protein